MRPPPQVSALQEKLPTVRSSSHATQEQTPELISRLSWSSPVCGVGKGRVGLPLKDASFVMANVMLSLNYCA